MFSISPKAPAQPDRRQQSRHLTILRVGTLILQERRELCLVRNISAGGLMAHVYSIFRRDQPVAAELKPGVVLPGRVSWTRESNIGIAFAEPINVEEMLAAQSLDGGKHARLPRVEADRLGTIHVGPRLYGVSTRDISQGGVKLDIDQPIDAGTEVVLELDKFRPLPGTVRWCQGNVCGVSFAKLIPFDELMRWLRSA